MDTTVIHEMLLFAEFPNFYKESKVKRNKEKWKVDRTENDLESDSKIREFRQIRWNTMPRNIREMTDFQDPRV